MIGPESRKLAPLNASVFSQPWAMPEAKRLQADDFRVRAKWRCREPSRPKDFEGYGDVDDLEGGNTCGWVLGKIAAIARLGLFSVCLDAFGACRAQDRKVSTPCVREVSQVEFLVCGLIRRLQCFVFFPFSFR